jgi:putative ABC transport system permease protein
MELLELLSRAASFLRNVFRRRQVDRDLDAEVASYFDILVENNMKNGMDEQNARRAARLEMGGHSQVQEEVRHVQAGAWLLTLWQDVRYAVRILVKNPTFTLVAVLTFAIGIGANTAIFSMVNGLLLRPLPVAQPQQLTYLIQRHEHWSNGFSYPIMEEIRKQSGNAFSDVVGIRPFQMDGLALNGNSQPIWNEYVTTNFFSMLGIKPALGNFIPPDGEKLAGSDPVLVLSYAYWQSHFAGDPNIVGRKASLNGQPITIIGVAPDGFRGLAPLVDAQGYVPLGLYAALEGEKQDPVTNSESHQVLVFARLKDGVDLGKAQSALAVIARRLTDQFPKTEKDLVLRAASLGGGMISPDGSSPVPVISALFLALAGLVLALASANVANLLLVRAIARNREMAVRSALGAARFRLVRQVLTETLLLALLGFAGGAVLGYCGSRALGSLDLRTDLPVVLDFHFDWHVFFFALGAAGFVALLAGLVPALRGSSVDLNEVMRESGRSVSPGRQRFRTGLVIAQVSGSLTLLIVAGLFVRSMLNAQRADLGFEPARVVNFAVDAHAAGYDEPRGREFYRTLLDRTRAMPGVESASLAATVPMGPISLGGPIHVEGFSETPGQPKPSADMNAVSAGYLKTMGITLLRGRDILDSDTETAQHVAVINEVMAQRYWPNQDPIGRQFTRMDDPKRPVQIVGVMKNSRASGLSETIDPTFYAPMAQDYRSTQTLQIRTSIAPATAMQAVREMVHSLDANLPVFDVRTMDDALNSINGLFLYRLGATLAGLLGLLGFVLALIGVYGVMSYSAAQRTHEIGIRVALGAQPAQVLKIIFRQGLFIVGLGMLIGTAAALALGKLVAGFLVGVGGADPLTYVAVCLTMALAALTACFVPARRAMKVDPMIALRYE